MADFCKQCSIKTFGVDHKDLAGITSKEAWAQGRACIVICEGCGHIQVDPEGNCVSSDCLQKGHNLNFKEGDVDGDVSPSSEVSNLASRIKKNFLKKD